MYIVMLNGHVACLKTTLSYLLAPALGLAHVSTSVLGPFEPRRDAPGFLSLRNERYRIAAEIAATYLKSGVSIIVDGTYALRHWRSQIYNLAYIYGVSDVVAVTCICSHPEILRERLAYRQRVLGAPDAKANDMEAYEQSVKEFEWIHGDRLPNGREISHIEFDSGTFEVTIRNSNSKNAESVAAVLQDLVKSGRLAEPLFAVTVPTSSDIILPKHSTDKRVWVAIEGIGGSGKTTQCRQIATKLHSLLPNRQVLVVKEFSNTSLGQFLRAHLDQDHEFRVRIKNMKAYYLVSLLVIADRMQTVDALSKSDWDLSILDELQWSLVAHAIAGLPRNISKELVPQVRQAVEIFLAHFPALPGRGLTFFLDISPEIALSRLEARIGTSLALEHLTFLQRLANAYRAVVEANPHIHVVDATQREEAVTETLMKVLIPFLK